jgi:hypothetical protein
VGGGRFGARCEKRGVVSEVGVHLTKKVNSIVALNLCHRLAEVQLLEGSGGEPMGSRKKLRMS